MTNSGAEIPTRRFGRIDERVSCIGLGGWHLGVPDTDAAAVRLAHAAIDAGVTFLDNAWDYNDGVSETRMGKAIVDRRDQVFLMTKVCTHGRDGKVAMRQLEESLRRLRTDYLDLWQIHEVVFDDEPARHFARGGVVEALERARQQGKVRYLGFTGHKDPSLHLAMLLSAPAQLFRRHLPELRAARAARAQPARHRADRDEELERRRTSGQSKGRLCRGGAQLRDESSSRDRRERHRLDEGAEAERRRRSRLQADECSRARGVTASRPQCLGRRALRALQDLGEFRRRGNAARARASKPGGTRGVVSARVASGFSRT
jgi:aryl-alcohol dehydrogenase-like predicted oxidoreductase